MLKCEEEGREKDREREQWSAGVEQERMWGWMGWSERREEWSEGGCGIKCSVVRGIESRGRGQAME